MRFWWSWIFFALSVFQGGARPGEVLSRALPAFQTQGAIYAAAEAQDGSFFVLGDFTEVDGIARPGLAKLDAGGNLDLGFAPVQKPEVTKVETLARQDPQEQFGAYWLDRSRTERLIPLANGGVILMGDLGWELRRTDGSLDMESLPGLARGGAMMAEPLFEQSGRLFVRGISELGQEIGSFDSNTLLPDLDFLPMSSTGSLLPAGDGKLWEFYTVDEVESGDQRLLRRRAMNGAIDPSFAPTNDLTWGSRTSSAGVILARGVPQPRYYTNGGNVFDTYHTESHSVSLMIFDPGTNSWFPGYHKLPFGRYTGAFAAQGRTAFLSLDYDLGSVIRITEEGRDPNFKIVLTRSELPLKHPTETYHLMTTSDGGILVGGKRMYLANGEVDSSWHVPRFSRGGVIRGFYERSSGEILVFGDFDRVGGLEAPGLVSLTRSGEVNSGFQADRDWRFTRQIHEEEDGRLIILTRRTLRDRVTNLPYLGRLDEGGRFVQLLEAIPEEAKQDDEFFYLTGFGVRSNGNLVVNTRFPMSGFNLGAGGWDKTFLGQKTDIGYESRYFGYLSHWPSAQPLVLTDDRFIVEKRIIGEDNVIQDRLDLRSSHGRIVPLARSPDDATLYQVGVPGYFGNSFVYRWTPGMGSDFEFEEIKLPAEVLAAVDLLEAGKFILSERQYSDEHYLLTRGTARGSRVRRFLEDGRPDPTFSVSVPGTSEAIIYDTIPVGDELWVGGDFREIGGMARNGVARLSNENAGSFLEWMEQIVDGREVADQAKDDPDGDGASNLEEFAAGSHPLEPGSEARIRWREDRWELKTNPDAKGVSRRIEVSDDLGNWRLPLEGEVMIVEAGRKFAWQLAGPGLFCRVVFREE